ncbi:hypothetical protein [Pelagibacterium lacus]|uniref:Nif11 family protein n=1 Tax=Pelagibacterium lacus TaxID=2282655 RepID=A0A369W798_9HYPH|nr:hypothetical protein [Pelagibacterium lacus]RDE09725.1 hypothetical protein DVH29_04075 [Pelagibacterium lacus]
MSNGSASSFFATVGADKTLTARFLAITEGKHAGDALLAIAAFAQEIGFDLTFEDIQAVCSSRSR